ncbi:MAG: hypothetical protein AAGC70_00920 [Pseudomonadota bacterium]
MALQDAAFLPVTSHVVYIRTPFASNNQHRPKAASNRAIQEPSQRVMRLILTQTVEIDPRVNRLAAASDATRCLLIECRKLLLMATAAGRINARGHWGNNRLGFRFALSRCLIA